MNSRKNDGLIYDAILNNQRISGVDCLMSSYQIHTKLSDGKKPIDKDNDTGNTLPPILLAAYEQPIVESNSKHRFISSFEKLTLAVRYRALSLELDEKPEWIETKEWRTFTNDEVVKAVRRSCHTLNDNSNSAENREQTPTLKLVGVKITGDLNLSKLDIPFSIRLIGCWITGALIIDRSKIVTLDLSGSLIDRGISASYLETRGSLRMRRTVCLGPVDLAGIRIESTMDLSDCVLIPKNDPSFQTSFVGDRGILNLGLSYIEKDIRMLRSRIYGGVNMRGAQAIGCLFMSDAILRSPESVLWHEAVSLGNCEDDLNATLKSARQADSEIAHQIWEGNKYLPVLAPPPQNKETENNSFGQKHLEKNEFLTYLKIERLGRVDLTSNRENNEAMSPTEDPNFTTRFVRSLLCRLLVESHRGKDCALRGEGMKIGGTLNARRARFHGRVRLKYCNIGSSTNFSGARFTTPRAIRNSFLDICNSKIKDGPPDNEQEKEKLPDELMRRSIKKFFDNMEADRERQAPSLRDEYVLDLQECTLSGSLDLGKDGRILSLDTISDQNDARTRNNKELIGEITRLLCATGEDPVKFIPVFFPRPGNPKSPTLNSKRLNNWKSDLESVSHEMDSPFYEWMSLGWWGKFWSGQDRPPGLINRPMSESDYSTVISANQNHGNLRSTIIVGEVILSGAHIRGSLRFDGAIAAPFESTLTKPTLVMNNLRIVGDFDMRDSVGFCHIESENLEAGGSVLFADTPEFYSKSNKWLPLSRRAFFTKSDKRENYSTTIEKNDSGFFHNFERSRIGGHGVFLFSHITGPSVILSNTKIAGKIAILPAIGALEVNRNELKKIIKKAINRRREGSTIAVVYRFAIQYPIAKVSDWILSLATNKSSNKVKKLEDLTVLKISEIADVKPEIDLRNAQCVEFIHPPSSWPKQDGLLIEGFRYERSSKLGPLTALRKTWLQIQIDGASNVLGIIGIIFLMVIGARLSNKLVIEHSKAYESLQESFGSLNSLLLAIFLFYFVFRLASFYVTFPTTAQARPLAFEWLKLQRRRLNTRRFHSTIVPWEPYLRAANVLRATGRENTANHVELQRLRARRKAMSLRSRPILRTILGLTDFVTRYGFNPMRTAAITFLVVLLGSCFYHWAYQAGKLYPLDTSLWEHAIITDITSNTFDATNVATDGIPAAYPVFESFSYAADVIIPFLDLNQEKYWVLWPGRDEEAAGSTVNAFPEVGSKIGVLPKGIGFINFKYFNWATILFKVFGWLLAGAVAIAVVEKIESIQARANNI